MLVGLFGKTKFKTAQFKEEVGNLADDYDRLSESEKAGLSLSFLERETGWKPSFVMERINGIDKETGKRDSYDIIKIPIILLVMRQVRWPAVSDVVCLEFAKKKEEDEYLSIFLSNVYAKYR